MTLSCLQSPDPAACLALGALTATPESEKLSLALIINIFDTMPIIYPMRMVPDDEKLDFGVPYAIRRMQNVTIADKVARMKARLKHYGVKEIFDKTTLAELETRRIFHNGCISRAKQKIDNAIVPRDPRRG
ncbi:hypothetical protein BDZ45DRAFT_739855 [Acephala macrosclerotiorum]|nr:hypothetical protein BDZ45DRAFT_739855 [Acephala macrosclerotiorum]